LPGSLARTEAIPPQMLGVEREAFMLQHPPIHALRRFWALETQRIILGTALVAHLR
jgi:hypothetical protein